MNPRIAFLGAPLLTLAYGVIRIIDGLDGHRGPGLAWTAGHLAFLGAMALFVVVFARMRQLAGRGIVSTLLTALATVGAVALSVQFGIDVVAGFMSDDHLGMSLLSARMRQNPAVSLFAYDLGPYLFYLGQLGLVIQLAAMRRIKAWTPLLVLFDLLMPFINKNLIPVGAVVLLISYTLIARRILDVSAPLRASAGTPRWCESATLPGGVPAEEAPLAPVTDLPILAPLRRRLRALPPAWIDLALIAVVVGVQMWPFVARSNPAGTPWHWWGYAVVVASAVPLLWRRQVPVAVLLASLAATACYDLFGDVPTQPIWYAALVAIYTVADRSGRWPRLAALVITVTGSLVTGSSETALRSSVLFIAAYAIGRATATSRAYTAALQQRAVQAEHERRIEAERAAERVCRLR